MAFILVVSVYSKQPERSMTDWQEFKFISKKFSVF